MRAHSAARLAAAGALLFACNGILGIESDYELAPDTDGMGGTNSGGASGSSAGGSAGTTQGGKAGATGATGGASGEGGEGGDAGASAGGTAGTSGGSNCGDRVIEGTENCDDENTTPGDGCSATCRVERGWDCDDGEPTHCDEICGDGLLVGSEAQSGGCDDDDTQGGDGCSGSCEVEDGWFCTGAPSDCAHTCGNGLLDGAEECDDENSDSGDGCDACVEEPGYACMDQPSVCMDVNECTLSSDNCDANANCTNTVGSFTCTCNSGYTGNGMTCTPNSCVGMDGTECQGGSCCESPLVSGGTFQQGEPDSFASTVSSFRLDKYEVTVARFRNFVNAYNAWLGAGNPATDAGANPNVSGSGWNTTWTSSLPASAAVLTSASGVQCDATFQTWAASGRNTLPINCVDWYTAFAFCMWDGGRLPTEAEWEYVAARGANDTLYPWGNTPVPDNTLSTANLAVYNCMGDGSAPGSCAFADILAVGSKPAGEGLYQQRDLAGSMWEWALDWYATYPSSASSNYAKINPGAARVMRGGVWGSVASDLTAAHRNNNNPLNRSYNIGFRCARAP